MEATEFFSSSFRILSYFADSNSGIFSHFSGVKNYFCKDNRYKPKLDARRQSNFCASIFSR